MEAEPQRRLTHPKVVRLMARKRKRKKRANEKKEKRREKEKIFFSALFLLFCFFRGRDNTLHLFCLLSEQVLLGGMDFFSVYWESLSLLLRQICFQSSLVGGKKK